MNKQTNIYTAIYKDKYGEFKTSIKNHFCENTPLLLSLIIDGVRFQGSSFDDFEVVETDNYAENQLKRFTFNKVKVWQSDKFVLELCNCELNFDIPIFIIDNQSNKTISTNLSVCLKLGNPATNGGIDSEHAVFNIYIDKTRYTSEGDVFEDALVELQNQFKGNYHFKNCFGCLYSDYSPYGNGFFGNLFCFKNTKKEYLAIKNKHDLIDLMDNETLMVQETHYCQQFEKRIENTGYRG